MERNESVDDTGPASERAGSRADKEDAAWDLYKSALTRSPSASRSIASLAQSESLSRYGVEGAGDLPTNGTGNGVLALSTEPRSCSTAVLLENRGAFCPSAIVAGVTRVRKFIVVCSVDDKTIRGSIGPAHHVAMLYSYKSNQVSQTQ